MSLYSKERKQLFFNDERFNDVTFGFYDSSETLRANKTILSLESPVFEKMFFGTFAEINNPVMINDIRYETFKKFLNALYHENLIVASFDEVSDIFFAAHKYEVLCIERVYEKYFIKNIQHFYLLDAFKFSKTYALKELESVCKILIENKPDRKMPCQWVKFRKGDQIPTNFFIAGFDTEGFPLGVGRFTVINDIIPGTFSVREKCVRTEYHLFSYTNFDNFEILCDGNPEWISAKDGIVPPNSVVGGRTSYGEGLHIAKCEHEGVTVIGKVHPSHKLMYFPWEERGLQKQDYMHLVDKHDYKAAFESYHSLLAKFGSRAT